MKPSRLILRGLAFYWRTNLAVILGVATTVAVLSGALLVGDSVRGSLRGLVLDRLGRTDQVIVSTGFMREQLAGDLQAGPGFAERWAAISPLVVTQAFVSRQGASGRAGKVNVYGVDDRFWRFHGVTSTARPQELRDELRDNDALISPALAQELGAKVGEAILVRVQRPSDVSLESLFADKDDLGRTMRAVVREIVPREAMGEFSLQAQQGEVRAVFLPLARLQRDLDIDDRVNALLVSAKPGSTAGNTAGADALATLVRKETELEDLGLRLRILDARRGIALESGAGTLDDAKATAALNLASEMRLQAQPVFTYLANTLRSGNREIPYSLVTAMDAFVPNPARPITAPTTTNAAEPQLPPIVLNDWAARDLQVAIGATVTMEYYLWQEPGRLLTQTKEFRVAGVVPISAGDRELAPDYPGITDSATLEDWDPPFPVDLRRVRPADEAYWKTYRTTPKAFIPFAVGRELWRTRYGSMTSIRIIPEQTVSGNNEPLETTRREYAGRLREKLDPLAMGLVVEDVRRRQLDASRGATDFGQYFVYFSFFLVVSALLLAALFFKLNIEQRAGEVGLLRAVGFNTTAVRRLFLLEGLVLSVTGAALGVLGGLGYGYLMVTGLRTWWIGAIGTTALRLYVSPISLGAGALGGILAAMVCIWLTLRGLAATSERRLLAGHLDADPLLPRPGLRRKTWTYISALACPALASGLMASAAAGLIGSTGAFFGAAAALLAGSLSLITLWMELPRHKPIGGLGWWSISRLGLRNATYRPARSIVSIAMIASATFVLISVDVFRRGTATLTDRHSGIGGYSLLVESLIPLVHDPDSREGREALGLRDLQAVTSVEPFRVRPGDDASCLNLYEPVNPRILAPRDSFLDQGRFAFTGSLASNDAERANPWLLLRREEPDGVVPVIADANSMTYVLKRKLGEEIVIPHGGSTIRLKLVAALDDSIFQGELLMSQEHFRRLFPEQEGYQVLLIETPPEHPALVSESMPIAESIEDALTDFGADVTLTSARLAAFHEVENTYLSTFQMLGGLGLLLGTVGLGAVLLRNVLERRRELALLRALGYRQGDFFVMIIAENAGLLLGGLLTGIVCALLAIAPVLLDRGGRLPAVALLALLFAVLVAGLMVSVIATAAALRSPLLAALREE